MKCHWSISRDALGNRFVLGKEELEIEIGKLNEAIWQAKGNERAQVRLIIDLKSEVEVLFQELLLINDEARNIKSMDIVPMSAWKRIAEIRGNHRDIIYSRRINIAAATSVHTKIKNELSQMEYNLAILQEQYHRLSPKVVDIKTGRGINEDDEVF